MDESAEIGSDIDLLLKLQNQPLGAAGDGSDLTGEESQSSGHSENAVVTESVGQLGDNAMLGDGLSAIQGYSEESSQSQDLVAGRFLEESNENTYEGEQEQTDPVNLLPEEPYVQPEGNELADDGLGFAAADDVDAIEPVDVNELNQFALDSAALEDISEASNDAAPVSDAAQLLAPGVEAISDDSNGAAVCSVNEASQDAPDCLADEEPMDEDEQPASEVDVSDVMRDLDELNQIAAPPVSHEESMETDEQEAFAPTDEPEMFAPVVEGVASTTDEDSSEQPVAADQDNIAEDVVPEDNLNEGLLDDQDKSPLGLDEIDALQDAESAEEHVQSEEVSNMSETGTVESSQDDNLQAMAEQPETAEFETEKSCEVSLLDAEQIEDVDANASPAVIQDAEAEASQTVSQDDETETSPTVIQDDETETSPTVIQDDETETSPTVIQDDETETSPTVIQDDDVAPVSENEVDSAQVEKSDDAEPSEDVGSRDEEPLTSADKEMEGAEDTMNGDTSLKKEKTPEKDTEESQMEASNADVTETPVEEADDSETPQTTTEDNGEIEMDLKIGSVQGSTTIPDTVTVSEGDDDVTVIGEEQAKVKLNRHKSSDSKEGSVPKESTVDKSEKAKDAKLSSKAPHTCIVCKKVGRCKYNIVRNGNTKHLCDDACFSKFRSTPTVYLRTEGANQAKKTDGDDDVEIVGTSRVPAKGKPAKGATPVLAAKGASPSVTPASKGVAPGATRQIICTVCKQRKPIKHEVSFNRKMHSLCSDKCFAAFRYANKLTMSPCDNCGAFCNEPSAPGSTTETIQFEGVAKKFCGVICLHSFRSKKKKMIVCAWCNTKKSNFDMVERVDASNKVQLFCTLNCLSLYRVNLQATSNQQVKCDQCRKQSPAQYHLTMSDASVRNFCSYPCVIAFQGQFSQAGAAKPGQKKPDRGEVTLAANANTSRSTRQSARGIVSGKKAGRARSLEPVVEPVDDPIRRSGRERKLTEKAAHMVAARQTQDEIPIISDVVSLADKVKEPFVKAIQPAVKAIQPAVKAIQPTSTPTATSGAQTTHIIIQPPKPKQVKNKSLLCKPFNQTKATSCRPHTQSKGTQTDGEPEKKPVLVPVPVPIYIPVPMAMYAAPQPYPVPIPIPIPVPCFIPTTRKSADGILRQIKEIQERMPADPFEAELLMMAEAVATADKSDTDTSSDDEDDAAPLDDSMSSKYQPPAELTPPSAPTELGEDMLQMALRMASEISEEPVLDLEDSLNPTPIQPMGSDEHGEFSTIDQSHDILSTSPRESTPRGRRGRGRGRGRGRPKRARYSEEPMMNQPETASQESRPAADADMVLKFTYGVNAWKHWVVQKNSMLEKASSSRRLKLFKADILACTAEELNYSLCLFVKEVRKPNGEEYAPDSIFYLCLGIQQYLYENGRIDDIFSNFYYEGYTDALNEVLTGYEIRLNAHGLLVCRIEEEHLWESKQLGAHSPYILLNTLIYFNTKYFFLKTPEEHLKLSFSHIMKHWKRANGQPITGKTPTGGGAKNVYLRYYAPTPGSSMEPGQKRKREEAPVYEQAENADNPLRCPVKLYEFYLSKCPESIKHRNDVFYLLPERSCVPDSPVWYSTGALGIEVMTKMLNRLRLVREIQEAHLHSAPVQYAMQ